ncbi:MAG: hypothetical protein KAJ19_21585 [Gammaproteobacteria bacterium]|nr:hypothetical protein [Gammaproteobacteria bacterium]
MKTKFGFKAQLVRYQGIIISLLLCFSIFTGDFSENPLFFVLGISIFFIGGIVILWLYPYIKIEEDAIIVKKIFISKKINFEKIDIQLKVRKLFKKLSLENYKTFGIDQRYVVICIKDSPLFKRYIFLTSQMENFDLFVSYLEQKIKIKEKILDRE